MTDTLAWDTYSQQRPGRRTVNASGQTTWFNWTQYPDHGPGAEILDLPDGGRVLDLGCGKAGNISHLAARSARAVGIDVSPVQLATAEERWGGIPSLTLLRAEAADFLRRGGDSFDAVYSVFGAVWFTDPVVLLPAVRERLRPGGVFAFSQRPPIEGCYGCQASAIPRGDDEDPLIVKRWDHEPHTWLGLLRAAGFSDVRARVLPGPEGKRRMGTLLVQARS